MQNGFQQTLLPNTHISAANTQYVLFDATHWSITFEVEKAEKNALKSKATSEKRTASDLPTRKSVCEHLVSVLHSFDAMVFQIYDLYRSTNTVSSITVYVEK